jgi:hypothetical protein
MTTTDERLTKSAGEGRRNRAMEDRTSTQNRELSDDERVEMFRQQFHRSALPDLPKLPGWHMCWLTTTNPRDSIQMRMQLGYVPVKPEDVPGWEYVTLKTGDYVGMIGVNEMLAFKLPAKLYKMYMEEAHYNEPLRQEEKLTDTAEFLEQQASASKSRLDVGDGIRELGKKGEAVFDLD